MQFTSEYYLFFYLITNQLTFILNIKELNRLLRTYNFLLCTRKTEKTRHVLLIQNIGMFFYSVLKQ